MLPKTARCRECTNLNQGYCAKRKSGRDYVHPGKTRRCPWFKGKA